MAAEALQHRALAGIINLRTLNQYVATAVADWQKVSAPRATLPRQLAPNTAAQQPGISAAGASSFGMSGVNAHVMMVAAEPALTFHQSSQLAWQRSR